MDKPLPKNPKSIIVEGRIVYICGPPCAKKIEADPKTYLQKSGPYSNCLASCSGADGPLVWASSSSATFS